MLAMVISTPRNYQVKNAVTLVTHQACKNRYENLKFCTCSGFLCLGIVKKVRDSNEIFAQSFNEMFYMVVKVLIDFFFKFLCLQGITSGCKIGAWIFEFVVDIPRISPGLLSWNWCIDCLLGITKIVVWIFFAVDFLIFFFLPKFRNFED